MKERIVDWFYTFPIQLVILHLRSNLFLLFLWLLTIVLTTGQIGRRFGWMYLMLSPEYLGEVSFWSFAIMGASFGAFLVTWNITTYILHSPKFPFLAALQRPFTKFFMNNSLIPLTIMFIFLWSLIRFQWYYECWEAWRIFNHVLGAIFGFLSTLVLTTIYFQFTNKDIFSFVKPEIHVPPNLNTPILPGQRTVTMQTIRAPNYSLVRSYINESFRWWPVRDVSHYESKYLLKVFRQNHVNAIVIQSVSIMILIITGYMIENPYFRIPAAASWFILLSIITSVAGVVSYWMHKWTNLFMITLLLVVNSITKYGFVDHTNKAFGLVYDNKPASYSYEVMDSIHCEKNIIKDKEETLQIMEKWKSNFPKSQLRQKPKMILIATSGGGLRAALWTMQVLQQTHKETSGKFYDHTMLLSGASGGMIGMGYFRELVLRKKMGQDIDLYEQTYLENISKDLLNPVVFTVVSNDIFMPWTRYEENGQKYPKDRGYIFEWELNKNTHHFMNKRLSEYRQPEREATVPMMLLSPSIVNDGRRLLISPQGVSYMATPPHGPSFEEVGHDGIDFRKMFAGQDADSLRFTTAIRANASFPYILPNVSLPSEPRIKLADAGFMDNMGLSSSYRFVHVFKDWIQENTSGIIFIVIRGSKSQDKPISERQGLIESAINPMSLVGRIVDIQDFEHDAYFSYTKDMFTEDFVNFIPFTYHEGEQNVRASMNFRLTEREKIDVINSFYQDDNQNSLKKLKDLLK